MRKITIEEWQHIPAGETISNGYAVDGDITAPSEPGFYTLQEQRPDHRPEAPGPAAGFYCVLLPGPADAAGRSFFRA